ncbi:MAG TPA: hypothetical protein VIM61_16605 [Chthoniobacterales bacterium]
MKNVRRLEPAVPGSCDRLLAPPRMTNGQQGQIPARQADGYSSIVPKVSRHDLTFNRGVGCKEYAIGVQKRDLPVIDHGGENKPREEKP